MMTNVRAEAGCVLQPLEARLALSGTYYEFHDVAALPGFDPGAVVVPLAGGSDSGVYLWSRTSDTGPAYVVADGQVRYLRDIPALADAAIRGVTSAGVALALDTDGADAGRGFTYNLVGEGERVYLDTLVSDPPAGFDLATLSPQLISDSGAIVLWSVPGAGARDVWVISEGHARYLWSLASEATGLPASDVNASGAVVGRRTDAGGDSHGAYWSAATGVIDLPLLVTTTLNDDGTVLGQIAPPGSAPQIATWRAGTVALGIQDQSGTGFGVASLPVGRDSAGRALVLTSWFSGRLGGSGVDLYQDVENFQAHLISRLLGAPDRMDQVFIPVESGAVIMVRAGFADQPVTGWFTPLEPMRVVQAADGEGAAIWQDRGVTVLVTRNRHGLLTALTWDGSGVRWDLGVRIDGPAPLDFDVYVDGRDGGPRLVTIVPGEGAGEPAHSEVWRFSSAGFPLGPGYETGRPIVSGTGLTAFSSVDGRAHVAAVAANGDLLLGFDSGSAVVGWPTVNLSRDHLAPQGIATPRFVGKLDSYATAWGGMNIVGLDENGQVWAVWWAPGMTLWTASNLSEVAGAAGLTGTLSAQSTPWGAVHIFSTDAAGHVQVLWWSPVLGPGNWRTDDLTTAAGGTAIALGTLASVLTPWNGMSVFARSAAGEVVTLWWAPGMPAWVSDSVSARLPDPTPALTAPLSAFVAPDGTQNIGAVTADGHAVRLFWRADGQDRWALEDLTALVG